MRGFSLPRSSRNRIYCHGPSMLTDTSLDSAPSLVQQRHKGTVGALNAEPPGGLGKNLGYLASLGVMPKGCLPQCRVAVQRAYQPVGLSPYDKVRTNPNTSYNQIRSPRVPFATHKRDSTLAWLGLRLALTLATSTTESVLVAPK